MKNEIENMKSELMRLQGENVELLGYATRLRSMLAGRGISVLSTPPDYPTQSELKQLLAIVCSAYPRLKIDQESAAAQKQFADAFLGLSFVNRADRPDARFYAQRWSDQVRDFNLAQCWQGEWTLHVFMAAVAAHADIPHTDLPSDDANYFAQLGLAIGTGRSYSGQFRKLLSAGKCAEPLRIIAPRTVSIPHNFVRA
jgi:hypothetical protein